MLYSKDEIIEAISKMSVIEVTELISMIEKKFSISSKELYNFNKSNNSDNNDDTKINEKTNFNILLKSIGNNKISVIKSIRSITNLGLKESKDLVDQCPVIIKENIDKKEAEKIKELLEESGAVIELQ